MLPVGRTPLNAIKSMKKGCVKQEREIRGSMLLRFQSNPPASSPRSEFVSLQPVREKLIKKGTEKALIFCIFVSASAMHAWTRCSRAELDWLCPQTTTFFIFVDDRGSSTSTPMTHGGAMKG